MARTRFRRRGYRGARKVLEARRQALTEDLHVRLTRMRDRHHVVPPPTPEEEDPADLDAQLLEISAVALQHVDQAIARLEDGKYGRCAECGGQIAPNRLAAMPFAVRCQPCAAARERESSDRADGRRQTWTEGFLAEGGREGA